MASVSTFFLVFAVVFLASGTVLTGSLGYAQLNGLSLTGDTYIVNFSTESGFSPNRLDLNYGDKIQLKLNVQEVIYDPVPGFIQTTFYFDGRVLNDALSDAVTFSPYMVDGVYNALIDIKGIGVHQIRLYVVYVGQEGQPLFQQTYDLTVTIYAPQVMKTLTLGVSGPGNVFCGPSPTTSELQVYSGEGNKVYTKDQYSIVYLSARPNTGSVFAYWLMGDGSRVTEQDPVITLADDMSAMAVFTQQASLSVSCNGFGYVTVEPPVNPSVRNADLVAANSVSSLQHPFGTVMTLTAWPLSGCVLDHWVLPNGQTSTEKTISLTLSSSASVQALFKPAPTVAPTASPSVPILIPVAIGGLGSIEWTDLSSGAGGTITKELGGNSITVERGHSIRFKAIPATNYVFVKFQVSSASSVTSNPYEVTADYGLSIAAYFTASVDPTTAPTEAPWTPSPTDTPIIEPTIDPTPIPTSTPEPTVPPTASPTPPPTTTITPNPSYSATPQPTEAPKSTFWIPKEYRMIAWIGGFASLGLSGVCFLFFKLTAPRRRF